MTKRNFHIFLPISEHLPFDLVAYKDNVFYRIQVKYRKSKNDKISIAFKSVYSNSKGAHVSFYDKNDIDYFAIYCPNTDKCYYLEAKDQSKNITLRISSDGCKNKNSHNADDFVNIGAENAARAAV